MLPMRHESDTANPLIERVALVYSMGERTGHAWVPRANYENGLAEVECLRCGLALPLMTLREWDGEPVASAVRIGGVIAEVQEPCRKRDVPYVRKHSVSHRGNQNRGPESWTSGAGGRRARP